MKGIIVIIVLIFSSCSDIQSNKSNWVTINYDQLINKTIITHNGKTVEQIIAEIPRYTEDYKGLVQPYLEPFSILCHDVLLSSSQPDTLPLINILTYYPIGSEQPAWAALFREGHYQLYYNNELIRIFLKGSHSNEAFDYHRSVIRHPINDLIKSKNTSIKKIEVYVFNNHYDKTEIRLNTTPTIINVAELNLSTSKKSIDLDSIEEFFKTGVALEAIEVDQHSNLFLYGQRDVDQSLAHSPVSLADFAVIYRAIFHYGNNAPYISLDTHEDNRYAKVNFGGHYENTHVGNVVLEADKLFKTLSTGLDPNTHELVVDTFTKAVPGFLTQDERNFIDILGMKSAQLRYWFYPDSIGTVTDGSIGAILNHQFHADIERMDSPLIGGNAAKNTIKHLNENYDQYKKANQTFKELSTVGRIMALVNWLKGMNIANEIDLDEFLTVKIPAFTTPNKTKKMFAITTACYPITQFVDSQGQLLDIGTLGHSLSLNAADIRKYTKVHYISDLLDQYGAATTDETFLNIGSQYSEQLADDERFSQDYLSLKKELDDIESQIEYKKRTLNRYSSREVDDINKLVSQANSLVNRINNRGVESYISIGGGISLHPKEFKRISRNMNSPKIKEINKIKSKIKTVGKISKSGNWLRSNLGTAKSKVNPIPANQWTTSKSLNGELKYSHQSDTGDRAVTTISNKSGDWSSSTFINDFQDVIHFKKSSNQLSVTHPILQKECIGSISESGKRITFH